MFEFSMDPYSTLRTDAALYACTVCPPPGEPCPDDDPWNPQEPIRDWS